MVGAFSVSPQSRSLFSASFQTFCLTAHAYLNTQKYGLFCSLPFELLAGFVLGSPISLGSFCRYRHHKRNKGTNWVVLVVLFLLL